MYFLLLLSLAACHWAVTSREEDIGRLVFLPCCKSKKMWLKSESNLWVMGYRVIVLPCM